MKMREITNLVTVNTSYSKKKAVDILKRGDFECLFIDLARSQEVI